jgi:hypothetical protein
MEEVADGTKVHVVTDMRITGPAASFGRGVMQDVSAKLMGRFADCLAEEMRGDGAAAAAAEPEAEVPAEAPAVPEPALAEASTNVEDTGVAGASSGVSSADTEPKIPSASSGTSTRTTPRPTDDVLDLGEASRDAVLKRALPLVGGVVALLILIRLIKR